MNIIYKYIIRPGERMGIPHGRIRKIAIQNDYICAWVEHKVSAHDSKYLIAYATGEASEEMPHELYLETVFNGPFVWHIYEGML